MALQLFAHPFSSYSQKALVALYENETPFTLRMLSSDDPAAGEELTARWPLRRFPILADGERTILEASIIIEHLQAHYPGPVKLIPDDVDAALEVRMLDRVFDNYISTPQLSIVFDATREAADHDTVGVAQWRATLEKTYAWLDERMATREWAAAGQFSLADCAAAPALLYADWTHPIDPRFGHLIGYRRRLLARPSFARAVNEARPYRHFFPLGAPDRD